MVGMAMLWGASWPAGRVVAQAMPPLAGACLRFALAAIVLLPWLAHTGGMAQIRHWGAKQWGGMLAAAATGVLGYAAFFLSGLQHLPASRATLFITLTPVLTLLLAAWLFRERLSALIGLGMALAVGGAVVVITHGHPWAVLDGVMGVGEWLIVGCVVCWSTYTLIGRWMLAGVDALCTTAVTSTLGAAMLWVASLGIEGPQAILDTLHSGATAWGALLMLGWGSTALAYAWYFEGVKALGAGAASAYITLVPVLGVAISALLLGEALELAMLAGGVMAVAGTAIMNFAPKTRPRRR